MTQWAKKDAKWVLEIANDCEESVREADANG